MSTLEQRHWSGFTFDWILVRELQFVDDPEATQFGSVTGIGAEVDVRTSVSQDQRTCRTTVRLTLQAPTDRPDRFRTLVAAVEGQFSIQQGEPPSVPLETFARRQAPAILMPYVRQAISSLTSGSRFGSVLLPPINVAALTEELEKRNQPALLAEETQKQD